MFKRKIIKPLRRRVFVNNNGMGVVFKFLCHFFKLYQKEMIYDHTYF